MRNKLGFFHKLIELPKIQRGAQGKHESIFT
jgi:hypothetical protein